MTRRSAAILLCVALLATTGCLGFITGDEPLRFVASNASVSQDALDETGYVSQESQVIYDNRTIEVSGQERQLIIRAHSASYARVDDITVNSSEVEAGETPDASDVEANSSAFILVSTPGAEVAGQQLNPLAAASNQQLVERLGSRVGGLENLEREETSEVTMLGEETNLTTFSAESQDADGQDVTVHLATASHEDDVVIAMAVHPVTMDEREDVETLAEAVEHEGEEDGEE